jgi:hypothetical protein
MYRAVAMAATVMKPQMSTVSSDTTRKGLFPSARERALPIPRHLYAKIAPAKITAASANTNALEA